MKKLPILAKRALAVAVFTVLPLLLISGPESRSLAQTAKLTHKQLLCLIGHAKTKADHEKLAAYNLEKVERAQARVKQHQAMLRAYESNTQSRKMMKTPPHPEDYCKHLIQAYSEQVKEFRELAEYHEDLAKKAGK